MAIRVIDLKYAERESWRKTVQCAVEDILGVAFDGEWAQCDGIHLKVEGRYEFASRWRARQSNEAYWQGVVVEFSFRDSINGKDVKRSLLVKPDGKMDEGKIQVKWAEMKALRRQYDQLCLAKENQERSESEKYLANLQGLRQLGIEPGSLSGIRPICRVEASHQGVGLEILRLTPAQAAQIVDLIKSF